MWQHNYEPLSGSLGGSAIIAALPIVVLFLEKGADPNAVDDTENLDLSNTYVSLSLRSPGSDQETRRAAAEAVEPHPAARSAAPSSEAEQPLASGLC